MSKITLNNVTVSDAYMALLADRGIDYWFANAGTDFAPVVETLAKAQMLETKVPKAVTCPHENTAMHMAIGYFLVTGKPQAVMVHVNVGTANGMNGLLNAARGQVPVLFTAGRTPTNEDGLAGHRSLDIHWTQEMFDQAGMLRESVKWDYELRNGQQLETVVDRALSIAKSEPMGPVYLSLPREVLSQPMAEFTYTTPSRQHAAAPAFPNGAAVEEVATLLAAAENPLIITSTAGRDPKAWSALAEFAERYAIPVIQYRNRYMSIPSNHPMNLGYELAPFTGQRRRHSSDRCPGAMVAGLRQGEG
jgi:acetolactate synthase-1/2/3 large subunit